MADKEIIIRLPGYIDNVFKNSSLNGEIDYLKSIFDDRDISKMDSLYEENIEIYKKYLIGQKSKSGKWYKKSDFLKAKRTLYYLEQSWYWKKEYTFLFSDIDSWNNVSEDFIVNEIEKADTNFDKFHRQIFLFGKEADSLFFSKVTKYFIFFRISIYLNSFKLSEDVLPKYLEMFWDLSWHMDLLKTQIWCAILEKLNIKEKLKELLSQEYDILIDLEYDLSGEENESGINYIKSLYTQKEMMEILSLQKDDYRKYNFISILKILLSNKFWLKYIEEFDNELKMKIEWEIRGNLVWFLHKLLFSPTKESFDYLEKLNVIDDLKNFLKPETKDLEAIELLFKLWNTKEWVEYIKSLFKDYEKELLDLYKRYDYEELPGLIEKISWKEQQPNVQEYQNKQKKQFQEEQEKKLNFQEEKGQKIKTSDCEVFQQAKTFIQTSDSGSCLLSWYRGTWKSSLLTRVITELKKENDKEIVQIVINIPEQKKDADGKTTSFNKNELITKIIREIYHSLEKSWYKWDDLAYFREQYVRTFKDIQEIEWFVRVTKRGLLRLAIDVLGFSIPIFTWLLFHYLLSKFAFRIPILNIQFDFSSIFDSTQLFVAWILIALNFLVYKTIINVNYSGRLERVLYNEDIAEQKLSENIKNFTEKKGFFEQIGLFWKKMNDHIWDASIEDILDIQRIFRTKKRKLVIIIDELDKLLDFEKSTWKSSVSMKDVFDILGKLKTLFFDNTWAIFFVVTNKDAYNYYLENKHSEDDLISNIFNKVLYLPMNRKENFNINRSFAIVNTEKSKLNTWLYYKSHGNWRKAQFLLSEASDEENIFIDKDAFDYDNQFYKFMDILYLIFYDKNHFLEYTKPQRELYEFITQLWIDGIKVEEKTDKNKKGIDWDYYSDTINKLKSSLMNLGGGPDKKSKEKYNKVWEKIDFLRSKYKDTTTEPFVKFSYIFSSVDKISKQPAYRDYIINNTLNILELLKHDRTIRLEDIFSRLRFWEADIKYPAFEDLVMIWIPFFVFYFDKFQSNEQSKDQ